MKNSDPCIYNPLTESAIKRINKKPVWGHPNGAHGPRTGPLSTLVH